MLTDYCFIYLYELVLKPTFPVVQFHAQKGQADRKQCKMLASKKITCKGTLPQVIFCLGPRPLLGFCMGWSSNFLGSESGQIQRVKLLQNVVSKTTQNPPPAPFQPHTVCKILNFDTEKGGGGEPERMLVGQQFTKLGRKYQHD